MIYLQGRNLNHEGNEGIIKNGLWRVGLAYNLGMANLSLVYGLRLLPADELGEVGDAVLKLKNGREARVTMHVLEGSKNEIEKQLKTSLEAFFEFYPEI